MKWSSFVTWTHITMWSKEYVVLWLDMWLLIISHPSVKFDSDRSHENELKIFFICHVTLCDHVINRLCDLMDNKSALEPTTLSSFVAIGLAQVEIQSFFYLSLDHLITWSKHQKTQWMVAFYYKPPPCQVWQSWASWKWRYIVFY